MLTTQTTSFSLTTTNAAIGVGSVAPSSSSVVLHSIERTLEHYRGEMMESLEELSQSSTQSIQYTTRQLRLGLWTTRITGVIMLCSSICMLWRAWNRRRTGLFHRLVLGLGMHLTLFGAASTIGATAVPSQSLNAIGNLGTTATCTAQGFLLYVTSMTAMLYYGSLSVYSYLGTTRNFQRSAVSGLWMEIGIHAFIHVYPICTGVYLIAIEIFNNSGFGRCFLENDPIGCGMSSQDTEDYVPCTRGMDSQKSVELVELFWDIPLYFVMILSTVVMTALFCTVRTHQSKIHIQVSCVAKQGFLYLVVMYIGILPCTMVDTLEWFDRLDTKTAFALNLFAEVMFTLFGLMSMLCYLYFTHPKSVDKGDDDNDDGDKEGDEGDCGMPESIFGNNKTNASTKDNPNLSQRRTSISRYSFNIFDGTNASGAFANFIYEGDSEDELNDHEETERWQEIQNSINSV